MGVSSSPFYLTSLSEIYICVRAWFSYVRSTEGHVMQYTVPCPFFYQAENISMFDLDPREWESTINKFSHVTLCGATLVASVCSSSKVVLHIHSFRNAKKFLKKIKGSGTYETFGYRYAFHPEGFLLFRFHKTWVSLEFDKNSGVGFPALRFFFFVQFHYRLFSIFSLFLATADRGYDIF